MTKYDTAVLTEWPEYKSRIEVLRTSNKRFARIMDVYQDTTDTVRRIQSKNKETLAEYEDELLHRCTRLRAQLMHMILDENGQRRH